MAGLEKLAQILNLTWRKISTSDTLQLVLNIGKDESALFLIYKCSCGRHNLFLRAEVSISISVLETRILVNISFLFLDPQWETRMVVSVGVVVLQGTVCCLSRA